MRRLTLAVHFATPRMVCGGAALRCTFQFAYLHSGFASESANLVTSASPISAHKNLELALLSLYSHVPYVSPANFVPVYPDCPGRLFDDRWSEGRGKPSSLAGSRLGRDHIVWSHCRPRSGESAKFRADVWFRGRSVQSSLNR